MDPRGLYGQAYRGQLMLNSSIAEQLTNHGKKIDDLWSLHLPDHADRPRGSNNVANTVIRMCNNHNYKGAEVYVKEERQRQIEKRLKARAESFCKDWHN